MREPVNVVRRCAVYTRKSTEDGLEQEFNSLDAQYEACAAYIISQRHEGWTLFPDRYDDGGFSGGNMERPGLKRLLADVAAGRVDVIVLYKIDRLTRSLSDFSKIVEVLDGAGASFVSITQAFNTTTSMGRLMLNVLLSFAQFEREVTGERIRDKIAASKRKGMWMGGPVPLGYDVENRRLVVNEPEAELVRHIMRRYIALGSVRELVDELAAEGKLTKAQRRASGPHRGGVPFRRGTLYHLLANRIYRGEIVHKGAVHSGEHEAIVPADLWEQVQATIAERASGSATRIRAKQPSLLAGLIYDGLDRPMTPSHATKGSRRYRYYVTRPDLLDAGPAWRIPAHDVEAIVCGKLAEMLCDRMRIHHLAAAHSDGARPVQRAMEAGDLAAATLRSGPANDRTRLCQSLIERVTLDEQQVSVAIEIATLMDMLGAGETEAAEPIILGCAAVRVRRGHELRLVIPSAVTPTTPRHHDEKLVALVAEAHAARALVMGSPDQSLNRIARDAGRCRTRLAKLVALSFLAPDIVGAIVEGRQQPLLTATALSRIDLPLGWTEQRALLGIS
jgi:site-specific DNA recombinase